MVKLRLSSGCFAKKKNKFKIIIIAGPTASGKSSLALHLAKKYNGIIINADSQQIYKELPILSSQPNKKDYKKISHKLFNFLDFFKNFSVNQWFKLVKKEIKETTTNIETVKLSNNKFQFKNKNPTSNQFRKLK